MRERRHVKLAHRYCVRHRGGWRHRSSRSSSGGRDRRGHPKRCGSAAGTRGSGPSGDRQSHPTTRGRHLCGARPGSAGVERAHGAGARDAGVVRTADGKPIRSARRMSNPIHRPRTRGRATRRAVRACRVGRGPGRVALWRSWHRKITCCRGAVRAAFDDAAYADANAVFAVSHYQHASSSPATS